MMSKGLLVAAAMAILVSACSSDSSGIEEAQDQFCDDVESYVSALDSYGGLFLEASPTVGEVRNARDVLEPGRDAVVASAEAFGMAVEEGSPPGVSIDIIEPETLAAVRSADAAFAQAVAGINDTTTVSDAGTEFSSAAYALEVAWARVFADSGCLGEAGEYAAGVWVADYVSALQADLTRAGYYVGRVDGVYGPLTLDAVEKLQASAGLPVTGLPDPATQAALEAGLGGTESAQIGSVQGVLISLGYYSGAVDGRWSASLEDALKEFQTDLGVPATGTVDTETLRAFAEALRDLGTTPETTTTTVPETTTTTTTTIPETTTTTVAETTTTTVPATTTTTTTPPVAAPGILDVLADAGNFTQLLGAIDTAGLTETLSGPGPFTLFAPTDDAFAAVGALPSDPNELAQILLYHVVDGELSGFDLADLAEVQTLRDSAPILITVVDGQIVLNGSSEVTIANVTGGNGVVHVVNEVLTLVR